MNRTITIPAIAFYLLIIGWILQTIAYFGQLIF